jgi:hypothetical protein
MMNTARNDTRAGRIFHLENQKKTAARMIPNGGLPARNGRLDP